MRGQAPLFDWAVKEEIELQSLAESLFPRGWLVERHRHGYYQAWEPNLPDSPVKALTAGGLRRAVNAACKKRRRFPSLA